MRQGKIYLMIALISAGILLSGCTYTENPANQETGVPVAETEPDTEAQTKQTETKQEKKQSKKQKKKKAKATKKPKENKKRFVCIEINITSTITAAFSGLPVVEAVYLNGEQIDAYYGDWEGNDRNDCVVCYCKIPDGSYKLKVETDGFEPVSLPFEVSKQTLFDWEGELTNASDEEGAAFYEFEIKQRKFGKELELTKKPSPLEEWEALEED